MERESLPKPEVCVHCGYRIWFGIAIEGEWSHWSGSTWCQDERGFTKTPLSKAQPAYHAEGDVL